MGPLYVFLASDLAKDITGRLFSASAGYVGLHASAGEPPLAFRDVASEGGWPLDALAEKILGEMQGS